MGVASMQGKEPTASASEFAAPDGDAAGSLYRKARALDLAGQCVGASEAYRRYSDLMRGADPVNADLALVYAVRCWSRVAIDPRATQADEALFAHDYDRVLALTADPTDATANGSLLLARGAALVGLGRTDDALATFRRAELDYARAGDYTGEAQAMWGCVYALGEAGRCDEAMLAHDRYARFVRMTDPRAAELLAAFSGMCRSAVVVK